MIACQAKDREPPTMDEGYSSLVVIREGDAKTYIDLIEKLSMPLKL